MRARRRALRQRWAAHGPASGAAVPLSGGAAAAVQRPPSRVWRCSFAAQPGKPGPPSSDGTSPRAPEGLPSGSPNYQTAHALDTPLLGRTLLCHETGTSSPVAISYLRRDNLPRNVEQARACLAGAVPARARADAGTQQSLRRAFLISCLARAAHVSSTSRRWGYPCYSTRVTPARGGSQGIPAAQVFLTRRDPGHRHGGHRPGGRWPAWSAGRGSPRVAAACP